MVRNIVIFGATGSVGTSALNVIDRHRERFNVVGIAANGNVEKLAQVAHKFSVENVGIFDPVALNGKTSLFAPSTEFFTGEVGLCELARLPSADSILMAIVGTAGVYPTVAAIESGKTILLASKEILVVAGKFIGALARENAVPLLPIDSEHNAIFQCLGRGGSEFASRLIITASGGPFQNFSREELERVTVEQALRHPVWSMGKKITIDSATMANKGLEIMEAAWLFSMPSEKIDVLIHPQCLVHSMVEFRDGSLLAQMCPPNMEFPISNCLFFPERGHSPAQAMDLGAMKCLTFSAPDVEKFPNLSIARECLSSGNNACAVFQAANEVAVEAFLDGRIGFTQMGDAVSMALDAYGGEPMTTLESCLNSVSEARKVAADVLRKIARRT
ncbi:MAG: 1-deoxy-D-xylulose-5-phosphate reductoisomerase [Puniceicoccales bacterium]|jgi:1-deoxy-D-xylulose-5-phosphate reductoisomerase|nr:1-deoxy-D-xylulose-5-phosphate reductoisomerase [Puniceicoccales bacterium]